jgi:hypothetical protein
MLRRLLVLGQRGDRDKVGTRNIFPLERYLKSSILAPSCNLLWIDDPFSTIGCGQGGNHKRWYSVCQHIRWKPTSPCKLWELQSEPHDVDPTGCLEVVGGVICKISFANHASHLSWILQITPSTSHELPLVSRSCDSHWSFHSLHEVVGFH